MHCEDTRIPNWLARESAATSPVPKSQGPGAPASQLETVIGTGATRPTLVRFTDMSVASREDDSTTRGLGIMSPNYPTRPHCNWNGWPLYWLARIEPS
jgi:hypothetical protein